MPRTQVPSDTETHQLEGICMGSAVTISKCRINVYCILSIPFYDLKVLLVGTSWRFLSEHPRRGNSLLPVSFLSSPVMQGFLGIELCAVA
jgi:hypothetical protein